MLTNCSFQVWLYSTGTPSAGSHVQSITTLLHNARIECIPCQNPEGKSTVLFLTDDQTTEAQEDEILQLVQDSVQHVIVIYTGEKKLPFYRVWRMLSLGADDVFDLQYKADLGKAIHARLHRWSVVEKIVSSEKVNKTLIGSCANWRKTLKQVVEMACFSTAPILILGESGTGKELIARLIHDLDKRPDKQNLILLDCTTIVPELSGSEFFGHEKGSFTNAVDNRDGAFSLADKGTLFLDEIGELPMRLQAELLRVIQEGSYKRVGSNIWKKTQFRLVCATNRDLLKETEKGHFRQDLYYRLSTCVVRLPPLKDRRIDIPELASHFLGQALQTDKPPAIDPLLMNFLMMQSYPGNVRQLRQLITRIAYRYTGERPVTIGDIPESDREIMGLPRFNSWQENGFKDAIRQAIVDGVGLKDIKRIAGDVAMDIAIEDAGGNLQDAARKLDVTDRLVQGYLAEKR